MSDGSESQVSLTAAQALGQDGSFEETLRALEAVVEQLERGRLTLADALVWYETGLALARRCSDLLAAAELQVSALESRYGAIREEFAPWDDDET